MRLVIGPAVVCVLLVGTMTRELNAFLLGDDQAQSIGVAVGRVRAALLVLTAVLVGSIVSVTGVIGFVGLVVPHAVRLVIGADHRWGLLPASALLGASFLAAADTVARVVVEPGSWQTGVVCALAGSPVFLLLVLRADVSEEPHERPVRGGRRRRARRPGTAPRRGPDGRKRRDAGPGRANGAGKSTLVRALVGLTRLSAGEVKVAGRPLSSWSARALAMEMSYVGQDHPPSISPSRSSS